MISRKNRFVSLAMMVAMLFSTVSFAFAFDEGMYAPGQIAGLPLGKKGLKIKPLDVYNPAGGGLTDAVIRLSIGCTAEFVSPEGLILTNHHCGFDALVSASTPSKDLVETGFKTESKAGEISAKNYSIFLTNRVEDVTAKIKAGTDGLSGAALAAKIKSNTDTLQAAEQAKAKTGAIVRIQMLNNGFFYYLYETQEIKDIRVVYAPPRNIGVFGGDPDNFEWTRHTGDFTFLRAYVAPDGSSATYSASNVPYKPKKFLTASIAGLAENDFVFVLGYPGGTTRYRESWSVNYAREANFPFLEKWLTALSDSLRQIGSTNEDLRIAFQSDIASFDNSRKAFGGGHLQLKRVQAVEQRRADEAKMATWIAANPERQKKYGSMLAELKSASEEANAAQNRDAIIRRFPDLNSMVVFPQLVAAMAATGPGSKMLTEAERAAKLKEVEKAYEDRYPAHEVNLLKFFLKSFDELPAGQKFKPAEDLFGAMTGQARREAEAKFADTIANGEYAAPARVVGLYGPRTMEFNKEREDILTFTRGLVAERAALTARSNKFAANIDRLRVLYMQALTEMKGISPVYPDANSTLRFSFGYIKGYQSRESEFRTPFTTMKGMIEKNTGEKPFDMPQGLIDMQNSKNFGRYGSSDSIVVNFLSTTDIIGGNSGSPILNANGEQVGICFDGNYEGLGNDFYFDTEKNRTISVDMRYVLFVTEKFGGAKWVVDEMKVVGKK
ncbi:MAG: S46 family peptidase [Acidobacteria bacterium]|nr:S46 family peptidase [Acidobacteriota bacterium]MBK9529519.1 S46 family peptidase [Acidobacteriota bacterium]MBP7476104.1 S46 family peptidase [Pyrinomonadaceae bacterium]